MLLTCHRCPRQLAFAGRRRELFASLFGWFNIGGRFFCPSCGETD